MKAQWLIDRYNVGLAQAVLLRSVLVKVEVRNERPARYRQLFRRLKFHRLLYRVEGSMRDGYVFQIDGPLNLFSATTKYGLQVAQFLPALLHCADFRLEAELRWGPKREPQELLARAARRPGLAPGRHRHVHAGRAQGVRRPVPPGRPDLGDHRLHRRPRAGTRRGLGSRLPAWCTRRPVTTCFSRLWDSGNGRAWNGSRDCSRDYGPPRFVLAISDRLKVDEEALQELAVPILRFKEIPNATELAALLDRFVGSTEPDRPLLP